MSKNSLDLEYMEDALKVKTGVKAGAVRPLYGVWYPFLLYGVIPLYGVIRADDIPVAD